MNLRPFHLAVPVRDIEEARRFYGEVLGLAEGRSTDHWIDFDMMGHQFVVHLAPDHSTDPIHNPVDGETVPVPHFGVVLDMPAWEALAAKLRDSDIEFVIEPTIRFKGKPGEQATMFFKDPSGNALEFKAFEDIGQLFAK